MKLDDKIIQEAAKKFGFSIADAKRIVADMIAEGLLELNTDPSKPLELRITNKGAKTHEEEMVKKYGEYREVIVVKKVKKMSTVEMMRRGMDYQNLEKYPKWEGEK